MTARIAEALAATHTPEWQPGDPLHIRRIGPSPAPGTSFIAIIHSLEATA